MNWSQINKLSQKKAQIHQYVFLNLFYILTFEYVSNISILALAWLTNNWQKE